MDTNLKAKTFAEVWGSAHPDLVDERFNLAYWITWNIANGLVPLPPNPPPDHIPTV
jgi:hypothetical protein